MSTWSEIIVKTEKAKKYLENERYLYEDDPGNRVFIAESILSEQIHCTEDLDKAFWKLADKNDQTLSLLKETEQRLQETIDKCSLYERIAKERAQRARKKSSDPSGYACVAIREIIDYYEKELSGGKKERIPIVAYKTTLSMPYPSQLGFSELRRLLSDDLLEKDISSSGTEDPVWKDRIRLKIGFDRYYTGFPADGKYPGAYRDSQICFIYRAALNIGKKYPEADLYSTKPLGIPAEMME